MNNIIEMEYLFYYKMCYWQGCIRFWCVIWIAESTNEDHFPLYLIVSDIVITDNLPHLLDEKRNITHPIM